MHAMIYKCQVVSEDFTSCMEYWSCPGEQVQMKSGINVSIVTIFASMNVFR